MRKLPHVRAYVYSLFKPLQQHRLCTYTASLTTLVRSPAIEAEVVAVRLLTANGALSLSAN